MKRLLFFLLVASIARAQTDLPGDYPEVSTRELEAKELDAYDEEILVIMRNEIFARYGYIFKNADLRKHFTEQSWYKPRFADVSAQLTELEKSNIRLLLSMEKLVHPIALKKLPVLSLPCNLEQEPGGDFRNVIGIAPVSKGRSPKAFAGLLPDTSRYYAVVWYSNESTTAGDPPRMYHVTTYRKDLTEIASASVSLPVGPMFEPYATDCSHGTAAHSSFIGTDLSFSSDYSQSQTCPGDEATTLEYTVSGQIRKDGTIVVKKDTNPFK
ncbi:hypothetical protein WSM22_37630 [Cytophagales bacterium WSM2-2]|nr:hypothetical protein WSM22_37630 [Cytophagales bacterium WSM2-2]